MTENNAANGLEAVDNEEDIRDESFTTESEAEAIAEAGDEGDDSEYYTVRIESGNLLWSLLAVIFAILSVVLFAFFYIGGIICAAAAIVFSIVSSRKLGYFDRMALFGLIFGIFGAVFGIFSMVVDITGVFDFLR
ncbi:MAG: hypothetical protein IKC87_04835 [Clostridia bacterium]|nr:hypothetical protein [Clostridia bacterium]